MSRDHHHHHEEEIEEEHEQQGPSLPLRIYEGCCEDTIPPGFDAITVPLDGRMQSDLDWKKARIQAQQGIDKGLMVMWEMNLGLFDGLMHPLANQGQFLALTLALEHFRDTLGKEFKQQTVGLSLYRGSADFSLGFRWDPHQEENLRNWLRDASLPVVDLDRLLHDEEGRQLLRLYCRDVAIEYIALLATRLPDTLPAYLFLDLDGMQLSPAAELQLLNPERFERLHLALCGQQLPFNAIGWGCTTPWGYSGVEEATLPSAAMPLVGICVPPMEDAAKHSYAGLGEEIKILKEKGVFFKLIPESNLTAEWDGLDYLFYSPTALTAQGKRKLQGFCAAGGIAVATGEPIGLPFEVDPSAFYAAFLANLKKS